MEFGNTLQALKRYCKARRPNYPEGTWLRFYNAYKDKHFQISEVQDISGYTSPWIEDKDTANKFIPYLVKEDKDGNLTTYLPTQEDILAKDWSIKK